MKIINVKIEGIVVESFSAVDGSVLLLIRFNDGKQKQVNRKTIITDSEKLTEQILAEIKSMEKNINYEVDEGVFGSYVNVIIEREAETKANMRNFLEKVSERVKRIKGAKVAEGYMDRVKELTRMELILE